MFPFVPVLIELAGLKSEFTSTVSSNKKKAFVAENVGTPTLTADVDEALKVVPDEWRNELPLIEEWFEFVGEKLPTSIKDEFDALKHRLDEA